MLLLNVLLLRLLVVFQEKLAERSISEVAEYLQSMLVFNKEKVYKNIEVQAKNGFLINTVCIYPLVH